MTAGGTREATFTPRCLMDLEYWGRRDRKTFRRVMKLIMAACRDPAGGAGKPKPLRGELSGLWSRRIDQKNRLVYEPLNGSVRFVQARYHYSK